MAVAKVQDLVERIREKLRTEGIATDLPNDFHYNEDVNDIDRGIALIAQYKRESGLWVVILGEVLQTVALFETNYVLYERRKAKELQAGGEFGRIITETYLRRKRRDLLSEVSSPVPIPAYV